MIQCNRFPICPLYLESYLTAAFDAESVLLGLVMVGHRNATIAANGNTACCQLVGCCLDLFTERSLLHKVGEHAFISKSRTNAEQLYN